jgi:hypothetical protein
MRIGVAAISTALFLVTAGCGQNKSAPAPAPNTPAATAPVQAAPPQPVLPLKIAANAGKLTLSGTVQSEEQRKQLMQDATGVYGAGNVTDALNVDPGAPNPAWLEQASTLFAWLKLGNPLAISGDASYLTLEGAVRTAAEKTERGQWANNFFGNTVTVTNTLQVQPAK